MPEAISTELRWLVLTVLVTAVFWLPYILNRVVERGLWPALREARPDARPTAAWASRMEKAHENAVENLVLFAPLVLAVELTGANSTITANACAVYFAARLVHYVVYTLGVPVLRTAAFAVGFVAQLVLAGVLLGG